MVQNISKLQCLWYPFNVIFSFIIFNHLNWNWVNLINLIKYLFNKWGCWSWPVHNNIQISSKWFDILSYCIGIILSWQIWSHGIVSKSWSYGQARDPQTRTSRINSGAIPDKFLDPRNRDFEFDDLSAMILSYDQAYRTRLYLLEIFDAWASFWMCVGVINRMRRWAVYQKQWS